MERSQLHGFDQIRDFVFSGRARFTIVSKKTGTRFTYRLRQPDDKKDDPTGPFFVQVLTGPENENDYQFAGTVWVNNGKPSFRSSPKSRISEGAPSVAAFKWSLDNLDSDQIEIWHEGRCGRCGKVLTVPESIASGLGPVCAGR